MGNAILRGQTGGASPTVISQKKLTLLADVTIYSPTGSVVFNNINANASTELLLVSTFATSTYYPMLFVNSNTVSGNYYNQFMYANASSISANRVNSPYLFNFSTSNTVSCLTKIKMTNNGYFVYQSENSIGVSAGAGIMLDTTFGTSTFTISSIDSLTVQSSDTTYAKFNVGSRFQLYSLNTGGEKTWVTS